MAGHPPPPPLPRSSFRSAFVLSFSLGHPLTPCPPPTSPHPPPTHHSHFHTPVSSCCQHHPTPPPSFPLSTHLLSFLPLSLPPHTDRTHCLTLFFSLSPLPLFHTLSYHKRRKRPFQASPPRLRSPLPPLTSTLWTRSKHPPPPPNTWTVRTTHICITPHPLARPGTHTHTHPSSSSKHNTRTT